MPPVIKPTALSGFEETEKDIGTPVYGLLIVTYLAVIVSIIVYFYSSTIPDSNQREWALLNILLCILPTYLYLLQIKRGDVSVNIPFLPIVGFLYAYYFALPGLLGDYFEVRLVTLSDDVLNEASYLACIGWLFLLLGFYSTGKLFKRFFKPIHLPIDFHKSEKTAWILIGIGILAKGLHSQFQSLSEVIQIIRFLSLFIELGIGLLIVMAIRKQLHYRSKFLLWYIIIPLFLFSQLSTGLTSSLLIAASYIFMVIWGVQKKISWVLIIMLMVSAVFVRGVMDEYRVLAWNQGQYSQVSVIDKSLLMLQLLQKSVINIGTVNDDLNDTGDFLLFKRSMLSTLAYTIYATPSYIPFWKGETYLSFPATIIPRFLWPDKPKKDLGQRFGHRYSLLGEWNLTTSMNLPQLIEFYINFGDLAVPIGMFLLGLIYQMLYQKINLRGSGDGTFLISALIFSRMMNVESDFSLIFGQVLQTMIIYYILFKLLRRI